MIASIPFSLAHVVRIPVSRPVISSEPMPSQRSSGMASRSRKARQATLNVVASSHAQSTGTAGAFIQMAVASSPPSLTRQNSTGKEGPSVCHSPATGNAPLFQINEPQPRQAIFILFLCAT